VLQHCQTKDLIQLNEGLIDELQDSVLGRELYSILSMRDLSPVFQPIVDIKKRKVFAYEALIRGPESSPLHSPLHLFHVAEEHGCLFEMDWLARQIAIEKYQQYGSPEFLFINVTVNALMQGGHKSGVTLDCLKLLGISVEQVVIEITELQPVEDYSLFVESINHYREMGFKVAIDDLGGGYNGLRIWSEVKPDFVKIDKHFVSGVAVDVDKRRFMETICALAKGLNTKIVAEGVEDEATLKVLEVMGVDYIQGYLFKKPQAVPTLSLDYEWPIETNTVMIKTAETVECIVHDCESFHPESEVGLVTEYLLKETQIDFVPVVAHRNIVGIVWRRDLMDLLARRFGRDLYHRKSIATIMDKAPVVVDINMPLVELSRLITDDQSNHKGDAFVISEKGEFRGCGRFMDLLRVMTNLKMESAQYANPLSGLPGNVPIQKAIQSFLNQQRPFVVIYVDVDHFKPYNDHYSFDQGDDIIRAMSDILMHHVQPDIDFIGHIGGDDFIIVSPRVDDYEGICEGILTEFRKEIGRFYLPEDRLRRGIQAVNREGGPAFFSMMSLSLGVLLVKEGIFSHQQKLASYATLAKKKAKSLGGDTFAVIDSNELN
jgi:EAL domain-containing protein (putative c-di-GMP-specific phosphodiesterase class I)/GGDEF domain-containing protein